MGEEEIWSYGATPNGPLGRVQIIYEHMGFIFAFPTVEVVSIMTKKDIVGK